MRSCGDDNVATKKKYVEVLRFQCFAPHMVFDVDSAFRNKRLEDYVMVLIVIDMECGNTKE